MNAPHFGRRRRRVPILRWIFVLAAAAGLLYFIAIWRVGARVSAGEEAMLSGQAEEARQILHGARFWRVRSGRVDEGLAAVELLQGRRGEAEKLLASARSRGVRSSSLDLERLARHLTDHGSYEAVELLAEHRRQSGGAPVGSLWQGEAALARGRLDEAEALLGSAPEDGTPDGKRRARLAEILRRRQASGKKIVLHDRRGRPVFSRRIADGEPILDSPELGEALTGPQGLLAGIDPDELDGRIELTLDLAYQKAAHTALGRFAGAFIAIDPKTGAILALVNHPEPDGRSPYRTAYEPGSVIKMITLAAALDSGIDLGSLFPLNCTGNMTLDGKVFYDWTVHGQVQDLGEATAVSCNLAFAAMGMEMGQARLDDALRRFGFGRTLDGNALSLPLGQLLDMDPDRPRLGLANRSVGLENIRITPVHLALLAAAFAHGGEVMRPHIVARRGSLGGEDPYSVTTPEPLFTPTGPGTAEVVSEAMSHVIGHPAGTGRRAAVEGVEFVMKTGTAGERRPGLDSVILGYAPRENPQVAFGFIARHAGKAEIEGARVVRDFLTTVRNEFGRSE